MRAAVKSFEKISEIFGNFHYRVPAYCVPDMGVLFAF
jgi:hypothetical protein